MRTIKTAFLFPLLLALMVSCTDQDRIDSDSKDIRLIQNSVLAKGHWKHTGGTSRLKAPAKVNSVSITCNKASMTCREVLVELVTPGEEPMLKNKRLFIHEKAFTIVDWSDEIIQAKYAAPVADFELRISIKDSLAERRWRETKARGSETADPNLYAQWTLE